MPSFRGDKYFLSNMYPCKIVLEGLTATCSESLYVAAKLPLDMHERKQEQQKIAGLDGFAAKKAGKKIKIREDWGKVRVAIMRRIVREKFKQNPELAAMLLATGDEELVEENEWGDVFWGTCKGVGLNVLGKILMKVRQELRLQQGSKTIIAGSRSIKHIEIVRKAVEESGFQISEVVSGTAQGVDKLGERWARDNSVPVKKFPANWDKYGKKAGYLRNDEMAKYADALIAVWDGESKGTKHMIDRARARKLRVYVFEV